MKMRFMSVVVLSVGLAACAQQGAAPAGEQAAEKKEAPKAPAPAGGGMNGTAEQQKAQADLEKNTPKLNLKEEVLSLTVPGQTIGETVGVAKNSKGHLFVFSRTGKTATVKGSAASMLFEFDQNNKYVRTWGENNYASGFAHTVRVDKDDNVWMTDEGANMVVKFRPDASVALTLGRKEEPLDWLEKFIEHGEKLEEKHSDNGRPWVFNRPTDVTWSSNGDIFVSDGYNNSRLAKMDKNGNWVGSIGKFGTAPDEFNTPHGITSDKQDNIYVADRGNRRIQVYGTDLKRKKIIEGMGAPWSVCATPANAAGKQFIFSGDGNGKIYKIDPDAGKVVGWAQTSQDHGQNGCLVHELHCESENVVYKGDCSTWQVFKFTIAN